MPHAVSMPSSGLQALILCGPGSSFPTFTSNPDEHPKALLPIANRPMVWYPIEFCQRMGISSITLICPPSASAAITTAFKTNPVLTGLPLPRPDILAPKDLDFNTGTAEILRLPEIKNLVTGDFVLLPCDLVCELEADKFLQAWMVQSTSLTDLLNTSEFANGPSSRSSGGLGVWFNTKASNPIKGEETDFIATTPLDPFTVPATKNSLFSNIAELVTSLPTDSLNDVMEDKKGLPIRHSLLKAHPRVRMLTNYRDAHIYVFPKWILEFIQENERLESIGEDVVGWWAKAGWQRGLAEKLHMREIIEQKQDDDGNGSSQESAITPRDAVPEALVTVAQPNVEVQAAPKTHFEEVPRQEAAFKPPPILAYTHSKLSETDALIRRVDTAQLLLATSLQLAKIPSLEETGGHFSSPYAHAKKVAYPEGVKPRTTITKQDSLVAENVTVEEKTSIKESVIGANCQIQEGAKLSQCLLMEGVIVGKNCKLTKCVLGKRCVIGDGSVLTDCEVQENLLVEARTEDKDNKLMSSEGLEATEAEMEEVLQGREAEETETELETETETETETEAETETTADDTTDDTASEA